MTERRLSFKSFWNKTNTKNSSEENHEPSERSRRSVLEGSKAFVWNNERPRTDAPYSNRKYYEAFNPPPNEINYIGGIGKHKAHIRSKLHPNRPTLLQKIYGMTRMNRIDVSLTQPLDETQNLVVRRKKNMTASPAVIKNIVEHISFSDFTNDRPPRSASSSSSNLATSSSLTRSRPDSADIADNYMIDGKPFYVNQTEIRNHAHLTVAKVADKTFRIDRVIEADRQFKAWAEETRMKFKRKDLAPVERRSSMDSVSSSNVDSVRIGSQAGRRKSGRRRSRRQHVVKGIHHMFAPLQKPVGPDALTVHSDKFGVPMTMINRVAKAQRKRRIRESYLRRIRFTHMGYIQPPDRDESSDNESLENVKKLALVRTPYFVIPTVKISQVRRKDRFRNKYLHKDRLKRINLLLSDRRNCNDGRNPDDDDDDDDSLGRNENNRDVESPDDIVETIGRHDVGETTVTRKHEFFAKFFELSPNKKIELNRAPEKQKFYELILDKYEEHRRKCEPQDKPSSRITFAQFKKTQQSENSNRKHAVTNESDTQNRSQSPAEQLEDRDKVLSKLFRRRKNYRLRRPEDVEGPLYTDPYLVDKLQNPKKFTSRTKTFASLFRTRFGVRSRLQVNSIELKDEKIGANKTYFNRLATEWDEYYIHELRHRPPVKKFRVKTDILMIRDIVRKNYIMYYTQENLLDLKAQQEAEVQRLNAAEETQEVSFKKYDEIATNAYGMVVDKNIELEEVQCANKSLRINQNALTEDFDKLTKDILIIEKEWEFLLLIQNYYYLLMRTEWRAAHDWIHRDAAGNLLPQLVAITDCAKRNMRDKSICTAFAVREHYKNDTEPKLVLMKAITPDTNLLKTSLESLMKKSFASLKQHNKSLWMLKKITQMHQSLKEDMLTFKSIQGRKIDLMSEKQKFMAERLQQLEQSGQRLLNQKLNEAMSSKMERKILGISEVLYQRFAPPEHIAVQLIKDVNAMDKFTYIHRYCMALLRKLDEIPVDILVICENITRDKRKQDKKLSKQAVTQQNRFEMWTKQIRHQFTPMPEFRRVNIVAPFMAKRRSKV